MHGDCGCEYPRCGGGRCIGSHFCPKHLKTPFKSKAEVNAYRRGQRDEKAKYVELVEASLEFLAYRDDPNARSTVPFMRWHRAVSEFLRSPAWAAQFTSSVPEKK